jgi:hypothetical protein
MEYTFDPTKFGFLPVQEFPELEHLYGKTTFIKITCVGGKEFDRPVYWYEACYNLGRDDRWKFSSNSFDSARPNEETSGHQIYMGLISTEAFATDLLMHLMAASTNDSVLTHGKERLEARINPLKFETSK